MAELGAALRLKRASASLASAFRGKSLFNETVKTMAFTVGILLLNVATGMTTARMLGPEGRGIQTEMILWPQFLAFAGTFGLPAALLYHMKKSPEEEAELYYSSFLLTLLAGAAVTVFGWAFIPIWMNGQPSDVVAAGQWFMAATPCMLLYFMHNSLFRGREEFHLFNRMRYLVPLVTLVLLIGLALTDRLTPLSSGIAYLVPYAPVTALAAYRAFRLYRRRRSRMAPASKKLMKYGLGSYGIDLFGNLILYVDQIILVTLLAPGPLGLYVVAVSLSRMINIFSASINLVLFPKASALGEKEAALLSLRVFKISTAIALICSAVVMLLAPFVIRLLYGSAFAEAIPVFRLLLLEVVLGGAALVLAQSFMAVGKPFVVTMSQAIGIVLVVPLMYWLVPRYGLVGAGYSLLLPSVVRLLYVMAAFQLHFRLGIKALLLSKEDWEWMKAVRGRGRRQASAGQ